MGLSGADADRGRSRADRPPDSRGPPPPPRPPPAAADRSPFFRPSKPSSSKKKVEVVTTPGGTRRVVRTTKEGKKTDVEEAKSGIPGTTANNISVIVGAGIVGMPYALREAGFLAGVGMIVGVAILTEKSLRLLIETAKYLNVPSYETLMEACFGYSGFVFISINMFITSYGGCLGFLIIIKDTIPSLLGVAADNVPMRQAILTVSSLLVILPLSLQRDMANLAKTSTISVINDLIVVGIVAFSAPIGRGVEAAGGWTQIVMHDTWEPSTIFVGLGVLSFAFVCQDSVFLIAGSLERPTRERWARVTGLSLLTCGTLALVCGVSGYLAFQYDTEGNILNNLPQNGGAAAAARALLGITMFFVYPLSSYVIRHIFIVLFFRGRTAHEGDDHSVLARRDRRVYTTVLIYLLTLVPALLFDDLGIVLGLAGAVGGSCIAYIGPGVTYLAAHGAEFLAAVEGAWDALAGGGGGGGEGAAKAAAAPMLWRHPRRIREQRSPPSSRGGNALSRRPPRPGEDGGAAAAEKVPLASSSGFEPLEQDSDAGLDAATEGGSGLCRGLRTSLVVGAWYLLLMPLWCGIAALGLRRVRAYEEDRALKSPRPSRLGRIVHKSTPTDARADGPGGAAGPADKFRPPARSLSAGAGPGPEGGSPANKFVTPSDYGATGGGGAFSAESAGRFGNKAIGEAIAGSIKRQSSSLNGDRDGGEEELRESEVAPKWWDFLIAICYIFLGLVAVTAGVVSISMGG